MGISRRPSVGSECTAFANAVRALENLLETRLIPGERVVNVSFPRCYARFCQVSGFKGRPLFPKWLEQKSIINTYLEAQSVKPGGHPNLKYPMGPMGHIATYNGIILPQDTIWLPSARKTEWSRVLGYRRRRTLT